MLPVQLTSLLFLLLSLLPGALLSQNTQEDNRISNSIGKETKSETKKNNTPDFGTGKGRGRKKAKHRAVVYYTGGTPRLTAVYKDPPHIHFNYHDRHNQPLYASSLIHQCWIVVRVGCNHILPVTAPVMTAMVHHYGLAIEGHPKSSVKATGSSVGPFDCYMVP